METAGARTGRYVAASGAAAETQPLLEGTDLTGAVLCAVDLADATLVRARLVDVLVVHAKFDRANLTSARLDGADLVVSSGLNPEQLSTAVLTKSTQLPVELAEHPWVKARVLACEAWIAGGEVGALAPTPEPTTAATSPSE